MEKLFSCIPTRKRPCSKIMWKLDLLQKLHEYFTAACMKLPAN